MGEINIRFKFDTTTGRKEIIVEYESDSDRLPVEHEKHHREIVEQLIGQGILKPDEASGVKVERVRPQSNQPASNPQQPADGQKVGNKS